MLDMEVEKDRIVWFGVSDKRLWPLLRGKSLTLVIMEQEQKQKVLARDMKPNDSFHYNSKMSLIRRNYLRYHNLDLTTLNLGWA